MRLVDMYCSQEYFDKLAARLGDFALGMSKIVKPDKVAKLPGYATRMAAKQKATVKQLAETVDPKMQGRLRAKANRYGTYAESANLQGVSLKPRAAPDFDINKIDPAKLNFGQMESPRASLLPKTPPKDIPKPKRFAWGTGDASSSSSTGALSLPVKKRVSGSVPLSASEFAGAQPWMAKGACPLDARMIQSFRDELEKIASWH
jgi:hypothetical protein